MDIIRSRFGYPGGGGINFKVANGTGRGRWRAEISFFQMYYIGTLANVVGKVECNLKFTNFGLCTCIAGFKTGVALEAINGVYFNKYCCV